MHIPVSHTNRDQQGSAIVGEDVSTQYGALNYFFKKMYVMYDRPTLTGGLAV